MKKIKTGKILYLIFGLIIAVSIGATAKSSVEKKMTAKTSMSEKKNEAENIAENFVNDYINIDYENLDKWIKTQPVTEKFKMIHTNQIRAVEISDRILNGEKVSEKDRKFSDEYTVDYGPIFGAAWADLKEDSIFKVKSYNKKTGRIILKDEKTEIEFPVNVVNKNGKWLIDGAGTVNIKE
ncbi:MAG: hypothetical protein Q4D53_03390 [Leptotrichiaceae bacterium]|nr:hypothetical protein [Leptotrichiaceae bacterium]